MKKIVACTFLACLAVSAATAQKRRPPARIPQPRTSAVIAVKEVSDADWKALAYALNSEDWDRSARLATVHLTALKAENEKKQLAQLRYLYVYALCGQILASGVNSALAEKIWIELDRAIVSFIGKEFVLPARPFSSDCSGKLNYICKVRAEPRALRTTATNKTGTRIHSFDYVLFDAPVSIVDADDTRIFLSGTLQKAEYNDDAAKPWVLRMFFNNGLLRRPDREKP